LVGAFFGPGYLSIDQDFERRSSTAHFALMRSFSVVKINPGVEFLLQLIDGFKHRFAECHLVELLQVRAVKTVRISRCSAVISLWFSCVLCR